MSIDEIRQALDRLTQAAQTGDAAQFRQILETSATAVRAYLMSIELEGTPPGFTASYVGDALQRFLHTLQFVPLPAGSRILELGANPYFFHILLRRCFPSSKVEGANFFDHNIFSGEIGSATHHLRSRTFGEEWTFTYPLFNLEVVPRYPFSPAGFDLIFLCETMEHLVVNPLPVFRKIRRLLAPGGYLIVTLPNAVRLINLACMLDGYNYFDLYHPDTGVHGRHNREFTLAEMKTLLNLHGFAVCRAETRDRFDYDQVPMLAVDYSGEPVHLSRRRRELNKVLKAAGGKLADRGDNLYLLAQRPPSPRNLPAPHMERGLVPCHPPPSASARALAFVDILDDDPGRLAVTGWAFLTDEWGGGGDWIKLVLCSADRCYIAVCSRGMRRDVADRYGLDRDDPGFEVTIDKAALPPGRYRLGVLLGGPGLEDGFRDLGVETVVES
jgi:SAM-dependent methyltransferase